mgnify:CR=1 FL=1
MAKKPLPQPIKIAIFAVVILAFYFGNNAVQTHLGETALAETGLTIHSLEEAKLIAQSENKLILADLSAIWCPSCRHLDRDVLSDPTVKAAIDSKYVFARIEYDSPEGTAFAETYEVKGFPNILILDSKGEKQRQLATPVDPLEFVKQL